MGIYEVDFKVNYQQPLSKKFVALITGMQKWADISFRFLSLFFPAIDGKICSTENVYPDYS